MIDLRKLSCVLVLALSTVSASAADHDTLVVGSITTPTVLNAIASGTAPGTPGTQVFAGLVELDDHFVPQPYLATSWEIAPDGLSYTFHLRPNAHFHDGTPITSEDVAFSVDTVRANHPFGRSMFGPVDHVDTPDALTAKFVLKQRDPALLASVTTLLLPIMPKHVYSSGPIRTNPANTMAIGSGPYKVTEFKAGQSITLEKNADFFLPGLPKTNRIVIRFFDDMQSARLALENGEMDAILQTSFGYSDFARLKSNPKLNVFTNAFAGLGIVDYLEFNLRKAPFNDVRVRRAIAHAIDRKFLVEKFQADVTQPLEGPLPPDSPFATKDLVHYDYDLEAAKKLLDEAGLKPDANGIRFKATIDAPTYSPDGLGRVADYLKPQLKKIGIELDRRISPDSATWAQRLSNYDYDIAMSQIYNYPDPVIGTHRLFLCKNQIKGVIFSNTGGYCNEQVDQILDDASKETDFEKRKALYAQFQKIITEDVPYVYTTTELPYGVASKSVTGLPKTVLGTMAPMLDMEKK